MPCSVSKSQLARHFFALSVGLTSAASMVAWACVRMSLAVFGQLRPFMPVAFWISTLLLAAGSLALQRASWHVRCERQTPFRRSLLWSLAMGTLFVGVQSSGLWELVQNQHPVGRDLPESAETGANAIVTMMAGMHGVHFCVALLFVTWVTVNAFADRYDHEYSPSVTFCAWFWHVLGIVWLAILTLFAAGAVTGFESLSIPDPQTTSG